MSFDRPRGARLDGLGLGLAIVLGGLLVAYASQIQPYVVLALLFGLVVLTAIWNRRRTTLPRLFLTMLGILLVGYALLGRGFAHIGVPPLYVGEICLGVGVVAVLLGGGVGPAFRSPVSWVLVAFMIWGAMRTIPYIDVYGLDALRDAVTWGYAIFAFLVAGFLLRSGWFVRAVAGYHRLVPWIIVATVAKIVLDQFASVHIAVPGAPTNVNLLSSRAGPMGVHLAGAAAFLALGLHEKGRQRGLVPQNLRTWLWWSAWLAAFLMAGILNRGGMVATLGALLTLLILRPASLTRMSKVIFVGIVAIAVLFTFQIEIDLQKRVLSTEQLVLNLKSVFGDDTSESLANTRDWRLRWWSKILGYTVFGEHFWLGKGFGINLSTDDGILFNVSEEEPPTRSPHNGHMTILARTGVPGISLWILLQGLFGILLLNAYLRARREGQEWWARIDLWILSFWIAFHLNIGVAVYLEGPYGGIWFWSLMGFGIAALEIQKTPRQPRVARDNITARPRVQPAPASVYMRSRAR